MGEVVHLVPRATVTNGEWQRLEEVAREIAEAAPELGTCALCGCHQPLTAGTCTDGCAA